VCTENREQRTENREQRKEKREREKGKENRPSEIPPERPTRAVYV